MSTERHHNSQFAAALSESKHLWLRLPRTFSSSLVEPRVRTGLTFCVQVLGPKVRSCLTCDDVGCNVAAGACLTSPGSNSASENFACYLHSRLCDLRRFLWHRALLVMPVVPKAGNALELSSWSCLLQINLAFTTLFLKRFRDGAAVVRNNFMSCEWWWLLCLDTQNLIWLGDISRLIERPATKSS